MKEDELQILIKAAIERQAKLSPLERSVVALQTRRSWVVGEMMLHDPKLTRADAIARFNKVAPEGLLLQDYEQRNVVARKDETGAERKAHYGEGKQPWDTICDLGWGAIFAAANVLKYLRRTKEQKHSLESARWYFQQLKRFSPSHISRQSDVYSVEELLLGELTDLEKARLYDGQ